MIVEEISADLVGMEVCRFEIAEQDWWRCWRRFLPGLGTVVHDDFDEQLEESERLLGAFVLHGLTTPERRGSRLL